MLEYLKDHIIEELMGATEYWTKAVEHKGTKEGCTFRTMAEAEIEHANKLTKMMTNEKNEPDEYTIAYKDVLEAYTTYMNKIEVLKKLYWSK